MSEFNVGDRVMCYGFTGKAETETGSYLRGAKGTITEDWGGAYGSIEVKMDTGETIRQHPKQCRKLKPKAPLLSILVHYYTGNGRLPRATIVDEAFAERLRVEGDQVVEFREVRKNKKKENAA